jgi:hypothetical protein
MEDYPFVLTTGARTYAFFHSEHRQIPYLRELNPDPRVEVNPRVAARLGIADGQWCEVFNHIGSAVLKAKITETVDEKTIHCQHGWWFPEADPNNDDDVNGPYHTFRSNVNNLIPNFHMGRIGFGAPFKSLICNIRPIEASWDTDMAAFWERFRKQEAVPAGLAGGTPLYGDYAAYTAAVDYPSVAVCGRSIERTEYSISERAVDGDPSTFSN